LFTSGHAPWHDFSVLFFLWGLIGLSAAFCMVMEQSPAPQLIPVRVRSNSRRRRSPHR
jgi:hypothetical protein